jgi:hypothetical protein
MARKPKISTITELLKAFVPDPNESNGGRLARFLDAAAKELPKTFISRRICAKIAFMQKRTPGTESDWVKKKLPGVLSSTKGQLTKQYGRDLYCDRIEGIRATVGSEDVVGTTLRLKQRRVVSAISSLQKTDELVEAKEVRGDLKKELLRSRRQQKHLEEYKESVPLLPPAKS